MRCPSCGAIYPDGFLRCGSCGAYISSLYQEQGSKTAPKAIDRFRANEAKLEPDKIAASLKTAAPVIGGVILVVISLSVMVLCVTFYPRTPDHIYPFAPTPDAYSYVTALFKLSLVLSPVGLVGGVAAMMRRYYTATIVGCAACALIGLLIFYLFGLFAALIAMALVSVSEGEFRPTFPKRTKLSLPSQ